MSGAEHQVALRRVLSADNALRGLLDDLASRRRVLDRAALGALAAWIATEGWEACAAYEDLLRVDDQQLLAAMSVVSEP